MQLVAVYGSLKKGYYNHRALGEDAEFLGTDTVCGVMYNNGSYPKLYKIHPKNALPFPKSLSRDHVIEVYRISDEPYERITSMELGAGYAPEDIKTIYGMATIYYMPHENFWPGDEWVEQF